MVPAGSTNTTEKTESSMHIT